MIAEIFREPVQIRIRQIAVRLDDDQVFKCNGFSGRKGKDRQGSQGVEHPAARVAFFVNEEDAKSGFVERRDAQFVAGDDHDATGRELPVDGFGGGIGYKSDVCAAVFHAEYVQLHVRESFAQCGRGRNADGGFLPCGVDRPVGACPQARYAGRDMHHAVLYGRASEYRFEDDAVALVGIDRIVSQRNSERAFTIRWAMSSLRTVCPTVETSLYSRFPHPASKSSDAAGFSRYIQLLLPYIYILYFRVNKVRERGLFR